MVTGVGKTFEILDKIPNPYSYSLGFYMPDWMGFTWIGNLEDGIHALPVLTDGEEIWGNGLGIADTTGCVVLSAQDAQRFSMLQRAAHTANTSPK